VMTIDNRNWASATIYYVFDFGRESFNCMLEHVEEGGTSNNLTRVIMKAITKVTNMSQQDIANYMVSFGAGIF
jgi:hypothetical protein